MKNFLFVILTIFSSVEIMAQDYLKNVKITPKTSYVEIQYNLNLEKGYFERRQRVKTRRFFVELYSSDDGKNYELSKNAKGSIGNNIRSGKNYILWTPPTEFGYIGKKYYKIEIKPIIPKFTWGLAYSHSIIHSYLINYNFNKFQLNFYIPTLANASVMLVGSLLTSKGESYYKSSSIGFDNLTYLMYERIGASFGLGFQSNNRNISMYFALGSSFHKMLRIYYKGTKNESSHISEGFDDVILDFGTSFKILDLKHFTVLIPFHINSYILEDYTLNIGLELQF